MPPTVVTASSPQDLLVLAAHTLGFWPQDSLVLVALHGPRRRSGLVVRADLSDLLPGPAAAGPAGRRAGEADRTALLDDLAAALAGQGASAVAALVCADVHAIAPEHLDLADALGPAARARDLELLDAVLISPTRRWSLTCARPCCPREGVALDLDGSPVAATAVLAGSAPAPTRAALLERATRALAPAPRAERAAVAAALAAPGADPDPAGAGCARAWWAALRSAASAVPLDPAVAATLLAGTQDLLVRDALMVSLTPTGAERLGLAGGAAPTSRTDLAAAVHAALAAACAADHPGDEDLGEAAVALLSRLCALAPATHRAGALALLAHLHWWWARPVHAEAVAARALAVEPDHALAGLVAALVGACAPPDWVWSGPAAGPRAPSRPRASAVPPVRSPHRRPRRTAGGRGRG